MRRPRPKPIYALIAGALLGLIVMPIALAGAASGPQATASASVKKQVKKLKKQVNQLRQQVEDISKQPGPQGPAGPQGADGLQGPPGPATGPAGGDLTGTYPNPLIGPNAVGTTELQGIAVTSPKIAGAAVGTSQLADNAVVGSKIQNDTIQSGDLGIDTVGSRELKGVTAVVGSGVTVNAGTPRNASVTCPAGQAVIGGGYAWQDDAANSIIANAPSETDPNQTWIVRGMVNAGSNALFAWANCLQR